MPSELNRRALFAAVAAFLLALTVAYALSSTGQASEGAGGTPGSAATPLDVSSSVAGQPSLGDAPALPALAVRPEPEPEPEPEDEEEAGPVVVDSPTPVYTPPVDQTPVQTPTPPPEPQVEFDDSG